MAEQHPYEQENAQKKNNTNHNNNISMWLRLRLSSCGSKSNWRILNMATPYGDNQYKKCLVPSWQIHMLQYGPLNYALHLAWLSRKQHWNQPFYALVGSNHRCLLKSQVYSRQTKNDRPTYFKLYTMCVLCTKGCVHNCTYYNMYIKYISMPK